MRTSLISLTSSEISEETQTVSLFSPSIEIDGGPNRFDIPIVLLLV